MGLNFDLLTIKVGHTNRRHTRITFVAAFYYIFTVFLLDSAQTQFIDNDHFSRSTYQTTPALNLKEHDVATVLLVDNKNRQAHGRFLNVKPEVGILTSTARTFIQEGITTEYATQVLGTTLDNGLYAQLLTKSSRVLYEGDNDLRPSQLKSIDLNNIIPNNNWQDDDDNLKVIPASSQFIKNTDDFIENTNAYLVFPTQADHSKNIYESNVQSSALTNNNNEIPANAPVVHISSSSSSSDGSVKNKEKLMAIRANVVRPEHNLPTYTIKNEFSPSGYSTDDQLEYGQVGDELTRKNQTKKYGNEEHQQRVGKVLFNELNTANQIGSPNQKLLTSVTYYGFADFTTIVGNTVIVFSPSTQAPLQNAQITTIKGEATLFDQSTIYSSSTQKPKVVKNTENYYSGNEVTTMATEEESELVDDDEIIEDDLEQEIKSDEKISAADMTLLLKQNSDLDDRIMENRFNDMMSIEPSETSSIGPMLSTPSSDDISKIFASLAANAAAAAGSASASPPLPSSISSDVITFSKIEETTSATTENVITPETQILGGVTTIFFEDDPFDNSYEIESTSNSTTAAEESTTSSPNIVTIEGIIPLTTEEQQISTTPQPPVTEQYEVSEPIEDETEKSTTELIATNDETTLENNTEQPKVNQDNEKSEKKLCTEPINLIPSTIYKTFTYLTTFFIPSKENESSTTTSIKSHEMITSEISYNIPSDCYFDSKIKPTNLEFLYNLATTTPQSLESPTEIGETLKETKQKLPSVTITTPSGEDDDGDDYEQSPKSETTTNNSAPQESITEIPEENIQMEIVTENNSITESIPLTQTIENTSNEDDQEEIELIYKTLYTTYTYLTTFFHDSSSSISSRKHVVTNTVSTTLSPLLLKTDEVVANLVASMTTVDQNKISSTDNYGIGRPTINNFILNGIDNILNENDEKNIIATPVILPHSTGDIKTYYTTYTYFTTIFVDGETEISSRTEVYTNYINDIEPTVTEPDLDNNVIPLTTSEIENNRYSTMVREKELKFNENDDQITMVTDVRSSSSDGERKVVQNRLNNILIEDQISSESNTEEIIPAPLLLLQTSYTTFTYFTTMYIGSTSSNVLSRLETITNVITESLSPTQTMLSVSEDTNLPIIYFTTFTYWTTLLKDGSTITTSREETMSNLIEPTKKNDDGSQIAVTIKPDVAVEGEIATTRLLDNIEIIDLSTNQSPIDFMTTDSILDPTTYYTTYTYFTTSYIGDQTVLKSRFETVTNILSAPHQKVEQTGRALDSNGNNQNAIGTDLETKKIDAPLNIVPIVSSIMLKPTGIVSINQGQIVDADGISTIFYTTKAIGSYINDLYAQVIESTSSVAVNDDRKSEVLALNKETSSSGGPRVHKTGLVRSIAGTIIQNSTTTLYQSKVIGTIIDGRYAQIIESTSSFLIDRTVDPNIQPTATQTELDNKIKATSLLVTTPSVIEGSVSESNDDDQDNYGFDGDEEEEEEEDDEEGEDGTSRTKSRLTFPTRKRTFTPVIRPFASRNRPTFNPKRKSLAPSSATIITRSNFTPTITATPALKSDSSRGRFSSNRRLNANNSNAVSGSITTGSASSRRFLRPRGSTIASTVSGASSTVFPGGNTRPRSSSNINNKIQPSSSTGLFGGGASSRRVGFRQSSIGRPIAAVQSSFYPNSRFGRIRPTNSAGIDSFSTNILTTNNPNDDDVLSTLVTEDPTDITNNDVPNDISTTESSRRNQNPLLRFRRPQIGANNLPQTTQRSVTISTRRSTILQRARQTSTQSPPTVATTSRPRANPFARPQTLIGLQNRPRPVNNLFPPRGLLQPTQINQELNNKTDLSVIKNDKENDNSDDDNDYDGSETDEMIDDEETTTVVNLNRSKRQIEYGTRSPSYMPRFRRPTTVRNRIAEEKVDVDENDYTSKPKTIPNRYQPRSRTNNNLNTATGSSNPGTRIRPTSSIANQGRSQFTLREKDINTQTQRSTFRRPTTSSNTSQRRKSISSVTPPSRQKSTRLRTYSSSENTNGYTLRNTNNNRARVTSPSRRTSAQSRQRGRTQDDYSSYVQPNFDGTITVTHHIPTEATIPVVNGKLTEYKNIVTAKVSTEIIGPKQYSTSIRQDGNSILVLSNDITGINNNGVTEITHFVLNETPTTSIAFTPTTIRGRRTSYSHVVPSTIYDVEQVITTIQPQIAANAPLANILLSQLLLGNLQQNINPLLALQGQSPNSLIPMVPTTEFKTKTTTYVTTVTSSTSTILPLTFRGKEILTTIVDSSINVITATEFLTETIVVTPTLQQSQPQQFNSLLLPLLLQQQQQPITGQNGQQNMSPPHLLSLGNLNQSPNIEGFHDIDELKNVYKSDREDLINESEEFLEQEDISEDNITSSILMYPNQFVTKTCLTTFTYLKTLIVDGVSKVESHEKVISNIATEEKNFFKITPTPTAGIILSQTPNLSVGYFQTTYTYLNTILDGELPLVVTSKHTVTNTITAPDDYLSLLQPSEFATPITDVNTYYSTIDLTKTQDDSSTTKLISTKEVLTRVVITESLPPKSSTSVMTSYIAIDDPLLHGLHELSTSDVVKTYYVTYTYYSTYLENNNSTIIRTNVSTSSDIVTEKLYLYPMKISSHKHIIKTDDNHHQEIELTKVPLQMSKYPSNLHIYATKTYLTSFTYYTTIEKKLSTAVNSHTKVIENVITETIPIDKIPMSLLNKLTSSLRKVDGVTTSVELNDGQKIEITAVNLIRSVNQSATKIPHLSSLQLDDDDDIVDDDDDNSGNWDTEAENSNIDNEDVDEDHDDEVDDDNKNEIDLVESEEDNIFSNDETQQQPIKLTSTKNITKLNGPTNNGPSLMSSFSLSSLNALGPMINAMAGLIQNNLGRRNDTTAPPPVQDPQNRSPIYIPVGNLVGGGNGGGDNQLADLIETSGSQNHPEIINFNTFHHPIAEKWVSEEDQRKKVEIVIGKPTHETPLLNGGIPISPGEVITANSDVIIGRPALIGPRIPLNLQVPDNTPVEMKPPPIPFTTPVVQQPSGHLKRNPLNSVPSSDQIPEIQQSHEIHVEHYTEKRHNHIPIHEHAQNTPTLPTKLKSSDFIQHHPKHHLQQSHQHQKSHHRLQWDQQQQQLSQQQENYHKDHDQQQQLLSVQQQHRHHGEIFYPQMMIPDEVFNHNKDEVVEIQRIPAIYSTDMPPFHVNNYGPSRITSAKQSALLVNLQPSQVANVLIPQGSSTALIIGGGSLEPHTRGQYFDDPIQYPDVNVSPNEKDHRTHERPVDTIQAGSNHKTVGRPDSKSHLIRNEIEMKISPFSNSVNVNVSPHPILVPPSNRINHLHTKVFYRQPSSNHHFQHNHQAQGSQQYQMESTPTTTTLPPLHPVQIRIKKINDGLDEMMDELNNDNQSIQQTSNEGNNYDNLFDKQVDNDENEMLSDDMVDEHKYDDLENEDGEVIQESNTRPLLPGQLPPEIVDVNERIETTPTLNLPSTHSINLVLNDVISPLHTSPVKNQPHINQRPHINHGSKQKLPIRNPISEIPQMRPPPLRPQIIQRLKPTPYNTNGLIHHRPSGGYDKLGEKSQSVSNRPEINLIERPYVIPTTGYQQYNLYANGTPNKNPGSSDLSKENPLNAQLAKYSSEKRPQIPNNLVLIPPNPVSTQQIHHYQQFGYNIKPQTVLNRPSNNSIESNKKAYNQQHTKISQLSQESATTSTSSSFNHISVTENILAPIIHPFGNSLVKQNISQLLPSSISSHSDIHHSPNNEFLQNQLIKQSSKPSTQVNSIENNIGHITEHRPYNTFIPQLPQSYQQQNNPSIQQIPIEKPSQFPNVIMSPPPPPPSFSPTHTASLIETHHQQQHKNTEVLDHNEQPIPQTTKKYPLIEYPDRQSSKHNIFHGTPINYHQSNNPNFERIPQAPSPSQPLASSPIVKYGNSKLNYKQISMPVNVVDNDRPSYSISTQTEDPYDPKIIKFNNFNDLTTSKNIEPLISTTVRPLVANITEHTTLLDAKNVFVEDGMQLNIGEMRPLINLYVNENLKVNTSATEYEKDFSEIFDFKESNNPHQFESVSYDLNSDGTSDTTTESSITMATETSTTLKDSSTTSTEPSKYSRRPETSTSITTITTITSNVTPEAKLRSTTPSPKLWSTTHIIPEPLEEMRPPPPPPSSSSSVLLTAQHNHHRKHHPHHYHHTVAENYNTVLGMSPPPLIRPSDTHHKHSNHHNSVLFNNQINLINDMYEEPITSTENILIPNVAIESINEMEEFETNSTLELSTTLTTTNKPTTLSTMRTPPTRRTRPPVTGITPPFYSSVRTPSATTPKVRVFITPETSFNPPFNFTTPQPLKRPVIINKPIPPSFIRIPSTTRQYPSIVQQPSVIITKPSDTLNDYVSFHSSIGDVSPTSLTPPKINQFSKHFDTKLSSDDVIIFGSETTLQNEYVSSTKQLMVPTENYPSIDSKSETLNINDRITSTISSTSFIVNTKTLTVTSTQTTVVSSHGDIPFTLTLVLTTTQTSTVIDTVTKTHTLIPEVVTKSIIEPTSIIQTITNIYSKYPEYSINESPNYNPTNIYLKDHGSNLNNEDSIESPLDEYVINYTAKTLAALPISKNKTMVKDEVNESIFVVMVDQNQSDINKKHSSVIKHGQSITTTNFTDNHYQQFESSVDNYNGVLNIADNGAEELPNRDEDDLTKDVNHVLLGGVLVASPPRHDLFDNMDRSDCQPDCKASKNELCRRIDGNMRCICRPGFARMFPDRPCKPTYTYKMQLLLKRNGKEALEFDTDLYDQTSLKYKNLAVATQHSLDRLVMQSDLRDIYHDVYVTGFNRSSIGDGVVSKFYIQLSDNADEKRLVEVFRKYLRSNNNSLGGTELYADENHVNDQLKISDFDECTSLLFNDCSENAQCFNLRGTYTCSCKEGYADMSENPFYPGRFCSAEHIGCEKCHYHGTCYTREEDQLLCECFQWYTGTSCHINLKVLLIALVMVGVLLVILLIVCVCITCSKNQDNSNNNLSLVSGIGAMQINKTTSRRQSLDSKLERKAMIDDSNSETSEESNTLPYVTQKMKQQHLPPPPTSTQNRKRNTMSVVPPPPPQIKMLQGNHQQHNINHQVTNLDDSMTRNFISSEHQKDRSLTVMIPRAKYYATPMNTSLVNVESYEHRGVGGGANATASVSSTTEAKLLSYLDVNPSNFDIPKKKSSTNSLNKRQISHHVMPTGALVSAGFEVSATVGLESDVDKNILVHKMSRQMNHQNHQHQRQYIGEHHLHRSEKTKFMIMPDEDPCESELIDTMNDWLNGVPQNDITVSEARSYDETTIQPPTKLVRTIYDKQSSHMMNDEANTMAERDLGSTFLLPHTHLYKPERGSDISGFDSL